jgi:hypothetical protein
MTQMLEKPASSAVTAIVRSRSRSSGAPPGHVYDGIWRPNRRPTGCSTCRAASGALAATARGAVRTVAGSMTTSKPSAAITSRCSRS